MKTKDPIIFGTNCNKPQQVDFILRMSPDQWDELNRYADYFNESPAEYIKNAIDVANDTARIEMTDKNPMGRILYDAGLISEEDYNDTDYYEMKRKAGIVK